jgi:hypothetical protein
VTEAIDKLAPHEARTIIEALRKGTVPVEHVPLFTVGRERWLQLVVDDLESYIAEGGAKVRFLNGDYGDGKTHFMSVIRHTALARRFAVSMVVLTREVPIHRFETVYQEIVRQLRGAFEGAGIRGLVGSWLEGLAGRLGEATPEQRSAFTDELRGVAGLDQNFANALAGLLELRYAQPAAGEAPEERQQAHENLMLWLEGGRATKRELKRFQVYETLSKSNSKRFLVSLVAFLRHAGHRGLVLLVDELETVLGQATSVRNAAYENVRLLIDNAEQAGHLHVFFSIIPDVLLSEKGFKSYDALWSRVRSIGEGTRLNYRGVLIDLHRTPLETPELVELGRRLRRIHELAYRWQVGGNIDDALLEKLCANQRRMGLLSEVRLYVKQIVRLLDMAEQGDPAVDELDLGEHLVASQREVEHEKTEQLEPRWDS